MVRATVCSVLFGYYFFGQSNTLRAELTLKELHAAYSEAVLRMDGMSVVTDFSGFRP